MTTVVGLTPDERGRAALHLGAIMARSSGDELSVAVVVPTPWPPNPYRADVEYLELQEKMAQAALEDARAYLGEFPARFRVHEARSVSSGLVEVAHEESATQVVLGSASSGLLGRVTLGGIAERVLHSTEVPVTLAPAGFTAPDGARITRVSVGYGRADQASDLLGTATSLSAGMGASLRVTCFAVHPLSAAGGSIEPAAEDLVVDAWRRSVEAEITLACGGGVETVVGQGRGWGEAVADVGWSDGDLLAIGASSSPVSRFFLGSHASKIVRHAPVPVTLLPRAVAA